MRGQPISGEQIEQIKATYAETGNLRASARSAGVSVATAKKYVESSDEFEQVRTQKRVDIIEALADARIKLLNAMIEPDALKKASLGEKSIAFGVVTDKHQLLTGEATERHEHRDTTQARDALTRRVDELAERRRARGTDGDAVGTRSA